MNSIFRLGVTKCVHINDHPYVLHDFALQKMSIFNALLFDEQFDQQDIRIELKNYDEKNIDVIFGMCYDSINLTLKFNIKVNINMLQLMMYFGLDGTIIKQSAQILSSKKNILKKILELPYHECFSMIMDHYNRDISVSSVMKYIKVIKETEFPNSFQVKFISKIVSHSFRVSFIHYKNGTIEFCYDIYNHDYESEDSSYEESMFPKIIYDSYNIQCQSVILDEFDGKINGLTVNGKEIEVIKNNMQIILESPIKLYEFKNIFVPTISNHIAKNLLGLEKI